MGVKGERPLCFSAISHTEEKHDHIQMNKADGQTPMMSSEQHTGLEFDLQQAREQAPSQLSTLVRRPNESGLISSHAQRGGRVAFEMTIKGQTISSLDGRQPAKNLSCIDLNKPFDCDEKTANYRVKRLEAIWSFSLD